MNKIVLLICSSLLISNLTLISLAQKTQGTDSTNTVPPKAEKFISKHSIKIDNKIINYTATVGTMILKNNQDQSIALFGYTAYTKDGETDLSKRPITFSYNGGPGSSSFWLHVGILGPKRVILNDPHPNGPAPYKFEDNNYSILDESDIVMIDPVGTGLSRPLGKSKNTDFWGIDQDIKSVSQFIKEYINENERWNSPKFLLGESYGTFRSAGVGNYLIDNYGIAVNGIVLISNILDFRLYLFYRGDDISNIVYLPTYAAASWYHNKLASKPADLDSFLKEVRFFAFGEYANALMKGDQLGSDERARVLNKLVAYTGISKTYWDKADLRINQPQFCQELLLDSTMSVGRYDSRYTGITLDKLGEYSSYDPYDEEVAPAFISAFMNYYTTELKVSKDKIYNTTAQSAYPDFKWDWTRQAGGLLKWAPYPPNTATDLFHAMSIDPNLKVLVLNGLFDMATPFAAIEYTVDHMGLNKKIKENIKFKYYKAGHMMYVNDESAAKFKKDVADFLSGCLK